MTLQNQKRSRAAIQATTTVIWIALISSAAFADRLPVKELVKQEVTGEPEFPTGSHLGKRQVVSSGGSMPATHRGKASLNSQARFREFTI